MTAPELQAFDLNFEAMAQTHPGLFGDPAILLDALCHHNPGHSREVCALIGARVLAQQGEPTAGNAAAFMECIQWLQSQAGDWKLIDPNGVMSDGLSGPAQ